MNKKYLVDRSSIVGDDYFVFEYQRQDGKTIYRFDSSFFDGVPFVQQDEVTQKIIEYKKKIIDHNIPVDNILIHPDLLELWNSTSS